jgi:hypothetical protein
MPVPPEIQTWNGHTSYEAVAMAGNGLDESRIVGRIAQHFAQPLDGHVQSVVKVNKGVCWPESGMQFLAGDDLVWVLEKLEQDLKRLVLHLEPDPIFPYFRGARIYLENTKTIRGV